MSIERREWTAAGGIALALIVTAALGLRLQPSAAVVEPGAAAPAFAGVNVTTATPATLETYRGKVVLLNVWATWCHPCRLEMPSMERLQRKFAGSDFHVVAVSVDRGSVAPVRAFVHELGLTFDVLHDPAGEIERTYRTIGLPETFLIDRQGVIVKKVIGATEWDRPVTAALVQRLLDGE